MMADPSTEADIIVDAEVDTSKVIVCHWCVERGVIELDAESDSSAKEPSSDALPACIVLSDDGACAMCRGLCHFIHSIEGQQEMAQAIKSADFQFASCALSLHLSVTFNIYEELVNTVLAKAPEKPRQRFKLTVLKPYLKATLVSVLPKHGVTMNPNADFHAQVDFDFGEPSEPLRALEALVPSSFYVRKARFNRKPPSSPYTYNSVTGALAQLTTSQLFRTFKHPTPVHLPISPKYQFEHASVYVAGRYLKFSRELSQTPWFIGTERKSDSSVSEAIWGELSNVVQCSEIKFSSAGREDCDVRMLGDGRPFVIECVQPRRAFDLTQDVLSRQEARLVDGSSGVSVNRMQVVSRKDVSQMKVGAEEKTKTYGCPIWVGKVLSQQEMDSFNATKDIVLKQMTPIRVSHRRTLMTRERTVYTVELSPLDKPHFYYLKLATQSGTYIKEFVHGDMGRTQPNLRTIFDCDVDILALDVLDVSLNWPAPVPSHS
eukprot:m.120275 g.120275  ORF g.120275 m.120275 type:complete len:489 (+) comp13685_c0_seq1:39-1505(+)